MPTLKYLNTRLSSPKSSRVFSALLLAALGIYSLGCSEMSHNTSGTGILGSQESSEKTAEGPRLGLGDLRPLGTILTPDAKERVATVLLDLWIDRIPEDIEIITRGPDGIYSGELGDLILQRRRVHTFTIKSGNPVAGDLVFYKKIEPSGSD